MAGVDQQLWQELKRLASLQHGDQLFLPHEEVIFDAAARMDRNATLFLKILWIPVAAFCAGSWFSSATQLSGFSCFTSLECILILITFSSRCWVFAIFVCCFFGLD
jgi:hypothetical protein